MNKTEQLIQHTRQWIKSVVIGCNFCPFASKPFNNEEIYYAVAKDADKQSILESLAEVFNILNEDEEVETALLIVPAGAASFTSYLQLVDLCEAFLEEEGHEGIYQLASFHPAYIFEGSTYDDPANYTNRSPYPMLHVLREASISKAVERYPNSEQIPLKNIKFAQSQGLEAMQNMRSDAMKDAD